MKYKLGFQEEAILDIRDAFNWYEEQQNDLGYFFIDELEECFRKICEQPQFYTAVNNNFPTNKGEQVSIPDSLRNTNWRNYYQQCSTHKPQT